MSVNTSTMVCGSVAQDCIVNIFVIILYCLLKCLTKIQFTIFRSSTILLCFYQGYMTGRQLQQRMFHAIDLTCAYYKRFVISGVIKITQIQYINRTRNITDSRSYKQNIYDLHLQHKHQNGLIIVLT